MVTATLRSFSHDQNTAVVSIGGTCSDITFHLCGSDRSVVTHLIPGQQIRFNVSRSRHGELYAVDVTPISCPPQSIDDRRANRTSNASGSRQQPRLPTQRYEPRGKPSRSDRAPLALAHVILDELLASCVIRQVMARDAVDPQDVRTLISSTANAIAARGKCSDANENLQTPRSISGRTSAFNKS
jgi:hypothetical protein